MNVSEATLKIRVFNFLQNLIINLSWGDSLGVPFGTPFLHFCLTPDASASLQRTQNRRPSDAQGLVRGFVMCGGGCSVEQPYRVGEPGYKACNGLIIRM